MLLKTFVSDGILTLFTVPGNASEYSLPVTLTFVSHIAGHADWQHLVGNFSLILILGPILEEKYGSVKLLIMILFTAIITGILNIILFETGLLGASGIVFMFILLSSITNYRSGEIPLTFILVLVLYIGREFLGVFEEDQVSQFGHILGGICGAIFGFILSSNQNNSGSKPTKDVKKDSVFKSFLGRAEEDYKNKKNLEY
jgi:GlpG protein